MPDAQDDEARHRLPARDAGPADLLARVHRVLALSALAAALALSLFSLRWDYAIDTPLLNYAGWLMAERGMVPYRDFFETSMPVTFALHSAIIWAGLDGNLAFSMLNNAILWPLAGIGTAILWRQNRAGAMLFLGLYITMHQSLWVNSMMQRDWLTLIPSGLALLMLVRGRPASAALRQVLYGLLFGIVALIKPHLAMAAALIVLADVTLERQAGADRSWLVLALRRAAMALAAFAAVLGLAVLWIWWVGALPAFLFLVRDYIPLHLQQLGNYYFLPPGHLWIVRAIYALTFGQLVPVFLALAAGVLLRRNWLAEEDPRRRLIGSTVFGMALLHAFLPILAGQFWTYHYTPFLFYALLALCSLMGPVPQAGTARDRQWLLTLVVAGMTAAHLNLFGLPRLVSAAPAQDGVVAQMEEALIRWLPHSPDPDPAVHPIDWYEGAVHAMLRQRVPLATPYMYHYHFHHHVSGPVTARMRACLMEALEANPPALVLSAMERPMPQGHDTDDSFPALEAFLSVRYEIVEETEILRVYLRREPATGRRVGTACLTNPPV